MPIHNRLSFTSDGTIDAVADAAAAGRINQMQFDATERLCIADGGAIAVVASGLPFTAAGDLVVDSSGPIATYQNGLPFTAEGRICVEDASAVGRSSGMWPVAASGRIAVSGLSWWDSRFFFSERARDAAPGGNKTLVTAANFAALGFTASGGTNGTLIDASGNLVAASAPRITHDRGATHCLTRWTSSLAQLFPDTVTTAGQFKSPDGLATLQLATSPVSNFNLGVGFTALGSTCTMVAYIKRGSFDYDANSKYGFYNSSTSLDIGYATPNYSTGKIEAIQSLAGTITARTEPMGNGVFKLIVTATGGMSPGDWCSVYAGATGGIVGAGRQHWTSGCHVNDGPLPLPFLNTFDTHPLFSAGTPTRQNLASGGGTQSIAVAKGCVYTVLHQSGGTYTLSGAGSGTTSVGTAATVVATTDSLTLTASGSPTLLQVYEGTAALPYIAGPISEYPQAALLIEPARTRETLHPRDLTQAAWQKVNCTSAKNQIGLDGVANSCSSLTATAGGWGSFIRQDVTGASATRSFSPFIRALSGSAINCRVSADDGASYVLFVATPQWCRMPVTKEAVTNPRYLIWLENNGDSIAVDWAQGEIGSAASSPIWGTESAAQTRSYGDVRLSAGLLPSAVPLTIMAGAVSYNLQTDVEYFVSRSGTGSSLIYRNSGEWQIYSYDGANAAFSTQPNAGTPFIAAVTRRTNSTMALAVNGGNLGSAAFNGNLGSGDLKLGEIGAAPNGYFTQLAISGKAATDAQLQLASLGQLP